ncbi:MAG: hypothetical protein ACRDKL_02840 [Solirubrobacteraceae bacterium]
MRAMLDALLKRRQLAVGLALVVAVIAAGLTLGHPRAAGVTGITNAARVAGKASVSGAVEACGGAAGGCRVMSIGICAPACLRTSWVIVSDRAGAAIAKARLRHGRFSVALAPGDYRLDLLATGRGGRSRVVESKRVTLPRNATRHVTFRLSTF